MNPRCIEQDKFDNKVMGCECEPVYECPETKVCERYIIHDVPHIMPMHTKIINHHIYRHSYTPCYTCEECDTCENVYEPMCKNF